MASRSGNAKVLTVTIPDGETEPVAGIDIRYYARGSVQTPASEEGTALTYLVSDAIAGTYVAYEDAAGASVAAVVESSKGYALPEGLFAFNFFKPKLGTAQTGATALKVALKR